MLPARAKPSAVLRPRAVALLVSALVVASGCAREDLPLEPVYRLEKVLAEPPSRETPERCEIGDLYRPSIGCVPVVPMVHEAIRVPPSREPTVDALIPASLRGMTVVAQPRVRGADGDAWRPTPPTLLPGGDPDRQRGWVPIALPAEITGERVTVQVFGRPVPPNEQQHLTRPLAIGRGAHLAVALGLDPLGAKVGASPVEFRVTIDADDGAHQVLREIRSPLDVTGWSERRVDLGPFAGRKVRVRLETSVVVRPDADPAAAFGFPLWGSPQIVEPRRADGRRNVILISLDTLRGDQLGGSLDGVPLMPGLARIAERGALFENASATYPSTTASHMTMFTGLYPGAHQVTFATGSLPSTIVTLPEILAANGYATVAATEDAMLAGSAGFMRGFDVYREFKGRSMWDTAGQIEDTFAAGLAWIESHPNERFFLFLHTYEVHAPYEPPAAFDTFHTWERDGVRVPVDEDTPAPIVLRNLYAGEVRYADSVLERLVERLEALGVLDDTILIVTSDHGDEFGEHGRTGHAKTAFDEVLHVPLVIVAPGLVPAGVRIATPVSLVDLAPTLLGLVRLPAPAEAHGESLVPLLRGEPFPGNRALYAEGPRRRSSGRRVAVRAARFKWVATMDGGTPILIYDLTVDPGEQHPVDDARLATLGEQMVGYYRDVEAMGASRLAAHGDPLAGLKPELDDKTVESLKALGYVD